MDVDETGIEEWEQIAMIWNLNADGRGYMDRKNV
jgi:hypothetical protein